MTTFPDTSGMTTEQLSKVICEWFDDPLNKTSYAAVQRTVEKLTNYHAPHGFMLEDFNLLCGMVSDELHKDRAEVRRDALLEAVKVERERIVKIVQGLLYEAESDAIGKPEYYDDVYLYKGIIDLIAAEQGQGEPEIGL